jgi:dTDP-4-dehydrorhamnose reductase
MKRIIITGAAGLLGQHLVRRLAHKHHLLCVDRADNPFEKNINIDYFQADFTDFEAIRGELKNFDCDLIFNCIALSDVDACETHKDLAEELNFELVNRLLGVPFKKLIHFSSDYVFDGKNGPYGEDDVPEPINYYGATKLHSENILQNSGLNYLIIRTNVLYGNAKNVRLNFVAWVMASLESGETIKVVDDQYNNPTLADNLAEASIEAAFKDITGILHIAGAEYLSRYEMALRIARMFDYSSNLIIKVTTESIGQRARRPSRGGLKIDKAKTLLKTKLLNFDQGLNILKSN